MRRLYDAPSDTRCKTTPCQTHPRTHHTTPPVHPAPRRLPIRLSISPSSSSASSSSSSHGQSFEQKQERSEIRFDFFPRAIRSINHHSYRRSTRFTRARRRRRRRRRLLHRASTSTRRRRHIVRPSIPSASACTVQSSQSTTFQKEKLRRFISRSSGKRQLTGRFSRK